MKPTLSRRRCKVRWTANGLRRTRSLRFAMLGFSGSFIVIGRIKLRAISTPGGLLDGEIDIPETIGRYAQCDYLTDSHHHVPGNHFNSGRRKRFVVALFPELRIDFIECLRLIVAQEDSEKDGSLLGLAVRRRIRDGWRRTCLLCGYRTDGNKASGQYQILCEFPETTSIETRLVLLNHEEKVSRNSEPRIQNTETRDAGVGRRFAGIRVNSILRPTGRHLVNRRMRSFARE